MTEAQTSGASAPTPIASAETRSQSGTNSQRTFEPQKKDAKAAPQPEVPFKGTKHRVKIEGQEQEIDYDELVKGYQTAQSAQRRYQEAQKTKAQAQQVLEIEKRLEQGDISYLVQKLGPQKARQVFENYLMDQLEYEQLPEHEKRARALEEENKRLKAEREKDAKSKEQEAYNATVQKAHEELDREISEVLKATGVKNPTPRLVLRILDEIDARLDAKHERIPAAEAREKAVQGIYHDIAEFLPLLPPEELVKRIPKSVLDAIRQHEVSQVIGEKQARRVKPSGVSVKDDKPVTQDEWFKRMESKLKKKRG